MKEKIKVKVKRGKMIIHKKKNIICRKYDEDIWGTLLKKRSRFFYKVYTKFWERKQRRRKVRFVYSLGGKNTQKRERRRSKFGKNLLNRQKFRKYYATLKYYQIKNFYIKSIRQGRNKNINGLIRFTSLIERRLGSVVYRMNFCKTIQEGHQRIRTGFYLINGEKVTYPNYIVKLGDVISVNPVYLELIKKEFRDLLVKKLLIFTYPKYMLVDYSSFSGIVFRDPLPKEVPYYGKIDLKTIYLAFKNKRL